MAKSERIKENWALDVNKDQKVFVYGSRDAIILVKERLEKLERIEGFLEQERCKMASPCVEVCDGRQG